VRKAQRPDVCAVGPKREEAVCLQSALFIKIAKTKQDLDGLGTPARGDARIDAREEGGTP